MRWRSPSKNLKAELLLSPMISVRVPPLFPTIATVNALSHPGLISQVAEELWEVADKTIKNLTKEDISIIDYKKNLIKESA